MKNPIQWIGTSTCVLLLALSAFGQSLNSSSGNSSSGAPAPVSVPKPATSGDSGRFGFGVKASLLGGGVEGAARVTHRTNVRGGFNMFSYSRGFNKDGVAYNGQLSFKTVEAHYDIFPFAGSFHVSPGVLAYIGNPIAATAAVPGNGTFTLGGTQYYSDPTAPITGNGKITFNRAAPMATIGWGNLVSRKETKHFSIPVELGVAFQGSPKAALGLAGNACDPTTNICVNAATDPTVQANIQAEQTKINNSMSVFKAYPIISVGFGYKF